MGVGIHRLRYTLQISISKYMFSFRFMKPLYLLNSNVIKVSFKNKHYSCSAESRRIYNIIYWCVRREFRKGGGEGSKSSVSLVQQIISCGRQYFKWF